MDNTWYIRHKVLLAMNACQPQRERFKELFGYRAHISLKNITKAYHANLSIWWLVKYTCTVEIANKCSTIINAAYERLGMNSSYKEYGETYCKAVYDALCEQINTYGELEDNHAPF